MKNKHLFLIWGGFYILCALLGFIPTAEGFAKVMLVTVSLLFFVPPWILFYRGKRAQDLSLLRTLRTLCLVSLGATLVFLVLFFMTAGKAIAASDLLYGFLVLFSAPMVCSQYWIISLFMWACLLMTCISVIFKAKKQLSQQ